MAEENSVLTMTAEIVASYLGSSAHVQPTEIPDIIRSVRAALSEDATSTAAAEPETPKATKGQINKSIQPHGITSFIDGKTYKTLRRHLTRHGHTPESYKAAHGLPTDYPMVAPEYSAQRSAMAKIIGLGGKGRGRAKAEVASPPAKVPKKTKKPAPVGES